MQISTMPVSRLKQTVLAQCPFCTEGCGSRMRWRVCVSALYCARMLLVVPRLLGFVPAVTVPGRGKLLPAATQMRSTCAECFQGASLQGHHSQQHPAMDPAMSPWRAAACQSNDEASTPKSVSTPSHHVGMNYAAALKVRGGQTPGSLVANLSQLHETIGNL
eukprot:1602773-Rhodomonas_salina.3